MPLSDNREISRNPSLPHSKKEIPQVNVYFAGDGISIIIKFTTQFRNFRIDLASQLIFLASVQRTLKWSVSSVFVVRLFG